VKAASESGVGSFGVVMDPGVVGRSPGIGRERKGTRLGYAA
jgi:hypothetical protein